MTKKADENITKSKQPEPRKAAQPLGKAVYDDNTPRFAEG